MTLLKNDIRFEINVQILCGWGMGITITQQDYIVAYFDLVNVKYPKQLPIFT